MELLRLAPDAPLSDVIASLDENGYALVEGVLPPADVTDRLAALGELFDRTPTGRNAFEGFRTQRIYAVYAKTRAFDDLAVHPLLLGALDHALGRHYQFSAPVALQIGPGEAAQVLHRDEDVYPLPRPHDPVVVNSMWALCDFTWQDLPAYPLLVMSALPPVRTGTTLRWLGEAPSRLLAATPRGIVLALRGFSGIFTVMAVDGLAVRYDAWDTHDLALAQAKSELLVDRLAAEVPGETAEAVAF